MRAFTTFTGVLFAAGILVTLFATLRNDPARAAAGSAVTITALTMFALPVIRKWILDASDMREQQCVARRETEAERLRYAAGLAAAEGERERLRQDMAYESKRAAARLATERAALQQQFADERTQLIAETFDAAVRMVQDGLLDAPARDRSVVRFPAPSRHSEAASTSRGVSRPS
jgi:hypothetical protein